MWSRLEQSSAINDMNKKKTQKNWNGCLKKKPLNFMNYAAELNQVVEWAVKLFVNSIILHVSHDKQLIKIIDWTFIYGDCINS